MVLTTAIRASNAGIKSLFPNPVALFVGGTSGVGQSTLEHLARSTVAPTIYLVGRSQTAGKSIVKNLKEKINPKGEYEFIEADCTLLSSVDKVCEDVKSKLKGRNLDIIVLSCAYLSFGGRDESEEGLDKLLSLRYYARLRFVHQLLPLRPKHVLSVLGGTTEGPLNMADLSLKDPKKYSFMSCAAHSSTMTSLSFEHLAEQHPETSFVHAFPGFVKTAGLTRDFSWWMDLLMKWIVLPLLTPMTTSVSESGERQLFYVTSARYPSRAAKMGEGGAGVLIPSGVDVAKGEGAYLVNAMGETGEGKPMKDYRESGVAGKVWDHTLEVFAEVSKKGL